MVQICVLKFLALVFLKYTSIITSWPQSLMWWWVMCALVSANNWLMLHLWMMILNIFSDLLIWNRLFVIICFSPYVERRSVVRASTSPDTFLIFLLNGFYSVLCVCKWNKMKSILWTQFRGIYCTFHCASFIWPL